LITTDTRTRTGAPTLTSTTEPATPITPILPNNYVTPINAKTPELLTISTGCVLHLGDHPGGTEGTTQCSLQRRLADCWAVEDMTTPANCGANSGPIVKPWS